jgi:SAM-dependent methyltransferase
MRSHGATVPLDVAASPAADPYAFSPGYYDLFRAGDGDRALPSVAFFAGLAPEGGSALELGPGTGRITMAVAERAASVCCLERSPTMRAVLVAKLAVRPDLWDRVTVLPGSATAFELGRQFDYVYLAGVLEHVPVADRPQLFRAIARHLAPGGRAAMDMVLTMPAPEMAERDLDEARLGECRYIYAAQAERLGPDLSRLRMSYRTYHHTDLICTEVVTRLHHMHRPGPVLADLAAAGLVPAAGTGLAMASHDPADPGAVVVRKETSR